MEISLSSYLPPIIVLKLSSQAMTAVINILSLNFYILIMSFYDISPKLRLINKELFSNKIFTSIY
jgi:hypothetical protein